MLPKSQAAALIILLATTIFICVEIGVKQPVVDIIPSRQWNWFQSLNNNQSEIVTLFSNNSANIQRQQPQPTKKNTNAHRKDYDYSYIVSYDNWIRGIGDHYLWNNESNSTCLYTRVPYEMDTVQAINTDIEYNHKHYCRSANSFSEIYDRVITAHCPRNAPLLFAEWNDIFHGKAPEPNSTEWRLIFKEESVGNIVQSQHTLLVYTIELKDTSQTAWISCNGQYQYHFALLSLQQRNETLYKEKADTIKRNFGSTTPPNVVIFITDSTARANFFRGAPSAVEYLSHLQLNTADQSRTDVLEFFRYSTVGWGTGQNLIGLAGGGCNICKAHPFVDRCIGLAQYYDSLGYESLGFRYFVNNKDGNRFPWQSGNIGEDNNCDFYLSENVLPKKCQFGNDVYWAKEYAIQSIQLQRNMDKEVPYFVIIHNQANHVTSGKLIFQYDEWMRDLVEYIDKENTILHIVGDHGSLVGGSLSNLFGQWEMRNPVSILMLPKWLNDKLHFLENMKINQQRHTNHYDMHYFFKQLLYKLLTAEASFLMEIKNKIEKSLPLSDEDRVLSKSLMDSPVALDRDCHGIQEQFCFCEVLQSIEDKDILEKRDVKYIENIIDAVNSVTGNGEWHCEILDAKQFVVSLHLENRNKDYMHIVIEKYIEDEMERQRLLEKNQLVSFSSAFQQNNNEEYVLKSIKREGKTMPSITRIDYFKYEECLTTAYDRHMFTDYDHYFERGSGAGVNLEPIFIDSNMTITMLKYSNNTLPWNLRVCHCKTG